LEAALFLERQELVAMNAGLARVELKLGLVAQRFERRRGHARDLGAARLRAELGERRDVRVFESCDLVAPHARDAREVVVLVSGAGKRRALRAVLDGPESPAVPASVLRRHPNCTILADRDAVG
jgi:hypothetical protein